MLLINTYFPEDSQNDNFDEQDLLGCLVTIETLLQNNHHDQVVLLGDLNCDFSRDTRFVHTVKNFCLNQDLLSAWNMFPADFSYSSPCNGHFSLVDHFLYSKELGLNVVNAGVIHRGDNVSGHSPIFLEMRTRGLPKKQLPEIQKPPKQDWKSATGEDRIKYRRKLEETLETIELHADCLDCDDLICDSESHRESLENYILNIIEAIETTTRDNIPYKNAPKQSHNKASCRKHIPGWKEHVEPYKEEANFWYLEWRAVGKPRLGFLYNNMRFL